MERRGILAGLLLLLNAESVAFREILFKSSYMKKDMDFFINDFPNSYHFRHYGQPCWDTSSHSYGLRLRSEVLFLTSYNRKD